MSIIVEFIHYMISIFMLDFIFVVGETIRNYTEDDRMSLLSRYCHPYGYGTWFNTYNHHGRRTLSDHLRERLSTMLTPRVIVAYLYFSFVLVFFSIKLNGHN